MEVNQSLDKGATHHIGTFEGAVKPITRVSDLNSKCQARNTAKVTKDDSSNFCELTKTGVG